MRILLCIMILLASTVMPVTAAVRTWTGNAGTASWQDPGNWDSGVPQDGDTVIMNPTAASVQTTYLNDTNWLISTLIFQNTQEIRLSGGTITLTNGLIKEGSTQRVECNNSSGAFQIVVANDMEWDISGSQLSFYSGNSIAGPGRITRTSTGAGSGQLQLLGSNHGFSGGFTWACGAQLQYWSPQALGSGDFIFAYTQSSAAPNIAHCSADKRPVFTSDIVFDAPAQGWPNFNQPSWGSSYYMEFAGDVSSGIDQSSAGYVSFLFPYGTGSEVGTNVFSGNWRSNDIMPVKLYDGIFIINNPDAVSESTYTLNYNNSRPTKFFLGVPTVVHVNVDVTSAPVEYPTVIGGLNASGTTGTFAGNLTFLDNQCFHTILHAEEAGSVIEFSGNLADANWVTPPPSTTIIKTGEGTVIFSDGNGNTYGGDTYVSNGTLCVMNTTGSATGDGTILVTPGAMLSGTGIITGDVTIEQGGAVAPGASIGTLRVGDIIMDAGSVFHWETDATGSDTLISDFGFDVTAGGPNSVTVMVHGAMAPAATNVLCKLDTLYGDVANIYLDFTDSAFSEGTVILDADGNIAITGLVGGPYLDALPSPLVFPEIVPGETTQAVLNVSNIGGGSLTGEITGVATPFSLDGTNAYILAQSEGMLFTFSFTSAVEGTFTNTITLSGAQGLTVDLIGTAVPEPALCIVVCGVILGLLRLRK